MVFVRGFCAPPLCSTFEKIVEAIIDMLESPQNDTIVDKTEAETSRSLDLFPRIYTTLYMHSDAKLETIINRCG